MDYYSHNCELRKVFDALKIEDGTEFKHLGRKFTVWISPYTEEERQENKPPIFYTKSSITDGYDIYLPSKLKNKFRKPACVHETIEAILNEELDIGKAITIEKDKQNHTKAHRVAKIFDELYAKETLSQEDYREYLAIKQKFGCA